MLSFALQNNIYTEPLLTKTPRYLSLNNYMNLNLFYLISSLTLYRYTSFSSTLKSLYILSSYQYNNQFYTFYNRILKYSRTLYLNNIIRSSELLMLKSLNKALLTDSKSLNLGVQMSSPSKLIKSVVIVPLSFQKKNFNKFIIFLLFLVTEFYVAMPTRFKLFYHYIFIKDNFTTLTFINNYYFKIKRI